MDWKLEDGLYSSEVLIRMSLVWVRMANMCSLGQNRKPTVLSNVYPSGTNSCLHVTFSSLFNSSRFLTEISLGRH